MKKQALSLAAIIVGACPAVSHALSLGEIDSSSGLGQPLRAKIELLSTTPEEVRQLNVRLAPRNVFSRVGIERPRFLDNIRFRGTVDGQGKPVILVSSDQPVTEPFVNFLLEVRWPQGELLKEYTVLLNPPALLQPGNTVTPNEAAIRPEPTSAGRVNRPAPVANRPQNNATGTVASQQTPRPTSTAQRPVRAPANRQSQAQPRSANTTQRAAAPPRARSNPSSPRVYRVRSGDTLFEVANRLRQPGANVDQMMMALLRANPDAFINNNINALKAGARLQVPNATDAKRLSSADARRQVRKQYADWRKFRSALAQNTVPQDRAGSTSTRGNDSRRVSDDSSSRAQQNTRGSNPRVEIVGNESPSSSNRASSSGRQQALEKQLDLAKEAASSASRKNTELGSRVKELEALVAKKDRLLRLRNSELASLKRQLTTARPSTQTPQVSKPVQQPNQPASVNSDGKGDVDKQIGTYVPNPVVPQPQADAGAGRPQSVLEQNLAKNLKEVNGNTTKLVETPDKITLPESPFRDSQEGGTDLLSLLTSPTAWTIGAGALASLLFLWLLSRFLGRRRVDPARETGPLDHYDAINDVEPPLRDKVPSTDRGFQDLEAQLDQAEKNDRFDDPFGVESLDESRRPESTANVSHLHDSRDQPVVDEVDQEEDEVLMEANVYIAYGLHQQAESELKKALEKHPDRLEYRHKLLENYFSANNREAFDQNAQAFLDSRDSRRDSKMWQDIATWGAKISPDNPLYREERSGLGLGAAVASAGAAVAGGAAAVSGLSQKDNAPPPLPDVQPDRRNELAEEGLFTNRQADVDRALHELDEQNPDFNDFDFGLDDLKQDLESVGDTTNEVTGHLVSGGKDVAKDSLHRVQQDVDALEARTTVENIDSAGQNVVDHAQNLQQDAQDTFDDTFDFTLDDLSVDSTQEAAVQRPDDLDDIESLGQALDRELDYTLDDLSTDLQQEASQADAALEAQRAAVSNKDDFDLELNELPADPRQDLAAPEPYPSVAADSRSVLTEETRLAETDIEPLDFDSLLGDEKATPLPSKDSSRESGSSGLGGMVAAAGAAAVGAASAAAAGLLSKKDRPSNSTTDNDQALFDSQSRDTIRDVTADTQRTANHAEAEIDDLLQFDDEELNFDLPELDAPREAVSEAADDLKTAALHAENQVRDTADDLTASAQQATGDLGRDLEEVGRAADDKVDHAVSNVTNLNLHLDKDSGLQKNSAR